MCQHVLTITAASKALSVVAKPTSKHAKSEEQDDEPSSGGAGRCHSQRQVAEDGGAPPKVSCSICGQAWEGAKR